MTESGENASSRKRVIVADISNIVITMTKNFLQEKYEVIEAKTGKEIIAEVFQKRPCDSYCTIKNPKAGKSPSFQPGKYPGCNFNELSMVILCLELPDYHAFDVVKKIRKRYHPKCLPVVLSTSNNKREVIMQALSNEINDYIVKPFPKELVLSKLNKLEREVPLADKKLSEMISNIPLFQGVPESQVACILNECSKTVSMNKGEVICLQDEPNFDLFILLEGKCEVYREKMKITEIEPIDTIGEMGFIGEHNRSATVRVTEPSRVIVFKKELLENYLNEERAISETICKNIILSMNERIKKSNDLIKQLKIMTEEYLQ